MSVTGVSGANLDISPNLDSPIKIEKTLPTLSTEEYIRKYFSDEPILAEIARCESQFRQQDKNGETLKGLVNKSDKGVMQINEYYHGEKSERLGFDIHTLEGNARYARFLFEKEGVRPWNSSSKCWKGTGAYKNYRTEIELAKK